MLKKNREKCKASSIKLNSSWTWSFLPFLVTMPTCSFQLSDLRRVLMKKLASSVEFSRISSDMDSWCRVISPTKLRSSQISIDMDICGFLTWIFSPSNSQKSKDLKSLLLGVEFSVQQIYWTQNEWQTHFYSCKETYICNHKVQHLQQGDSQLTHLAPCLHTGFYSELASMCCATVQRGSTWSKQPLEHETDHSNFAERKRKKKCNLTTRRRFRTHKWEPHSIEISLCLYPEN